jgi:AcrR family transcriptional regulator
MSASDASTKPASTHARILDAAVRVCADKGLHGATTREIAEAAQVNEVTLFRHFGSKEKLIAALFTRAAQGQVEALSDAEPEPDNLREALQHFAERFERMLFEFEPLIRTLIGEAHRQPAAAKQVIMEAVKPTRMRFLEYLRAGQKAGAVRRGLELEAAVDAFTGMLLSGMLRRTSPGNTLEYEREIYLNTAVELFLNGIAGKPQSTKGQRGA